MAEPHPPRAGRPRMVPRPVRALLLAAALFTVVLGGLFIARPASAATSAPAARAATAAPAARAATVARIATVAPAAKAAPAASAAKAATAAKAEPAVQLAQGSRNALLAPDGGICSVPVLGDLGGLVDLCNAGTSGLGGDLNNICSPGLPEPEVATSGINSLITTPGSRDDGQDALRQLRHGRAVLGGDRADNARTMTSLIGNNVAGMVFDMAKSLDRVTITVYQSAAGANILAWLSSSVDNLITALGNAIYFPFLAPVVIIGAIWLAWQGLIRKRATRTIEGTIWMVIACAAAIWLIGQPNDFTDVGTTVSNGVTSVLNTAFDHLPAGNDSNCLPVQTGDPQSVTANYAFTSGNGLVDQNANELWSVLVCKPWLEGEFGTTQYANLGTQAAQTNLVDEYGRNLLWAQAFATNEQPTATLTQAKQQVYSGIAANLQRPGPGGLLAVPGQSVDDPARDRLLGAVRRGRGRAAGAADRADLDHLEARLPAAARRRAVLPDRRRAPGFGRVVAIRWFEMLVGVLLKQVAVALVAVDPALLLLADHGHHRPGAALGRSRS